MNTRFVETEQARAMLIRYIEQQKLPFQASIANGRKRTYEQNRLQRLWLSEIAEQLGDQTAEEVRGYCKLTLGVPILREENVDFRERYDAIVKPLPYEHKLALMMEPLDFPVTRLMSTRQKAAYLDAIWRHFSEKGIVLTDPDPFLQSEPERRPAQPQAGSVHGRAVPLSARHKSPPPVSSSTGGGDGGYAVMKGAG